jgi:hypothetical protein
MRLIPTCAALAALTLSSFAPAVLAAEPAPMDEAARMQYALGYQLGRDLAGIEARPQDMLQGLTDGRSGAKAKLTELGYEFAEVTLPNTSRSRVVGAVSGALTVPQIFINGEHVGGADGVA